MAQFGHFSAKVYSILDPNTAVYLPYPKLNCLMWITWLCSDGYLSGQDWPILPVRGEKGKNGVKQQK